jgi:hypothetical protein
VSRLTDFALISAFLAACMSSSNADVPLPRAKPPVPASQSVPAPVEKTTKPAIEILSDDGLSRSECEESLKAARVAFRWVGEKEIKGCTVENAVEVNAVEANGTSIAFPQKPVLACGFAELLGRWTGDIAGPVLAGHTGSSLVAIATGPGLVCRNRVGTSATKVSEHAKGNAIDVTAFALADKRMLQIGSPMSDTEARALRALRLSACGYFTTVLGPGANPAHATHFHFDYGKHGKTYNYRLCE